MNSINKFIKDLAETKVNQNTFNQYSYKWKENEIRRNNLKLYLESMKKIKPKIILIAEAPGYRDSRLTGVPFTSEYLLMNNMPGLNLFGEKNGYRVVKKEGRLLKEATATMIWQTLIKYELEALAWNAYPFHPHRPGNARSNRTPLKGELLQGERFLIELLAMYKIERIIAVGNKAAESLNRLGISYQKVRHPAQGGKREFVEGMKRIKEKMDKK